MQGFVIGYVGKRVRDRTTLIGSVITIALSYLVLVSVCGGVCACVGVVFLTVPHSIPDDDHHSIPAVSHSRSDDNGRGSSQHPH